MPLLTLPEPDYLTDDPHCLLTDITHSVTDLDTFITFTHSDILLLTFIYHYTI